MNAAFQTLSIISAMVVLVRTICVSARLNRKNWKGNPLRFTGISFSYAMICGGALGIPLCWNPAPHLLLLGIAMRIVSERRGGTRCGR